MCYDSSYYEWARRAARMKEEMKREEERKNQGKAPAETADPKPGKTQPEPVPA